MLCQGCLALGCLPTPSPAPMPARPPQALRRVLPALPPLSTGWWGLCGSEASKIELCPWPPLSRLPYWWAELTWCMPAAWPNDHKAMQRPQGPSKEWVEATLAGGSRAGREGRGMWKATQEEKGERKAKIGKESQMGNKTEGRNQEKGHTRALWNCVFLGGRYYRNSYWTSAPLLLIICPGPFSSSEEETEAWKGKKDQYLSLTCQHTVQCQGTKQVLASKMFTAWKKWRHKRIQYFWLQILSFYYIFLHVSQ